MSAIILLNVVCWSLFKSPPSNAFCMYGTILTIDILLGAGNFCLLAGGSSFGATKTPAVSVCFPVSLLFTGAAGGTKTPAVSVCFVVNLLLTALAGGGAGGGGGAAADAATVRFPLNLLRFGGSSTGATKIPAVSVFFPVSLLLFGGIVGGTKTPAVSVCFPVSLRLTAFAGG